MKWIEAKMQELGVSTNANYKITFMLDSAAMITVHTPRRGLIDVSLRLWATMTVLSDSALFVLKLTGKKKKPRKNLEFHLNK